MKTAHFLMMGLLVALVLVSGCTKKISGGAASIEEQALQECVKLCQNYAGNLNTSPCLSDNNPNWTIPDWACDTAHSPRLPIDDIPIMQCRTYLLNQTHHFVELDENCKFINKK